MTFFIEIGRYAGLQGSHREKNTLAMMGNRIDRPNTTPIGRDLHVIVDFQSFSLTSICFIDLLIDLS